MQNFIKINDKDNVVVALQTISQVTVLQVTDDVGKMLEVTAMQEIPAGHKMAISIIPQGGEVIKYGYRIGYAKEDIRAGEWIHTHNVKTGLGDLLTYQYEPVVPAGKAEIGQDSSATSGRDITGKE